jgi:hypothetical protein
MRTLLLLALLGAACSSPKQQSKELSDDEAAQVLVNRNWMDHWPTTKTDRIHVYRFVPNMGGGVYQDRTIFKGTFELFRFDTNRDEIEFDLVETGQKVASKYRIDAIDGPHPFDLRLTVFADPRGPQVYFGIRSETDPDGLLLEQKLRTAQLK